MRIGFFTDYTYPGGHGVETTIDAFGKGLAARCHEVFIYAPYDKEIKDTKENIFRFRAVKLQKNPKMFLSFPLLPVGKSRKEILDFKLDIVHAHSALALGMLAKQIARKQKIPLIYEQHTDYPTWLKDNLRDKLILPRIVEGWVSRYANQADAIIAPSPKIKLSLEKWKVKRPIYFLPNCIDLDLFHKDRSKRDELRKKYDISLDARVLIFVGRLSREKNLIFLLQAAAEVVKKEPNTVLMLVGEGYQKEKLQKTAEELGIGKNIRLTGFIPHDQVSLFYNASDLFVMSSLSEVMPVVVMEALATGLPCVVLDDLAFHDTVFEGENGFVVKENEPARFADKVLELLQNKGLYEKFSKKAEEVAQGFGIEEQTKKLLEIYKTVAEEKIAKL